MKIVIIYDALIFADESFQRINAMLDILRNKIGNKEFHIIIPNFILLQKNNTVNYFECNIIHALDFGNDNITLFDYCQGMLQVIQKVSPTYVFAISSAMGRAITAWLSVRLNCGVVADVVSVNYNLLDNRMILTSVLTTCNLW